MLRAMVEPNPQPYSKLTSEPDVPAPVASSVALLQADEAYRNELRQYRHQAVNWSANGALLGTAGSLAGFGLRYNHLVKASDLYVQSIKQLFESNKTESFVALQHKIGEMGRRAIGLSSEKTMDQFIAATNPLYKAISLGESGAIGRAETLLSENVRQMRRTAIERGFVAPLLTVTGSAVATAFVSNKLYHGLHHAAADRCLTKKHTLELLQQGQTTHRERIESERESAPSVERA